ncbi:hypothetical protein CEXT_43681, partial [Caerostris extrusa]
LLPTTPSLFGEKPLSRMVSQMCKVDDSMLNLRFGDIRILRKVNLIPMTLPP